MPILPIDTGRYGTREMKKIFEEEARIQRFLDVEAAVALAHASVGNISKGDAERIAASANIKQVKLHRVKEIEHEIKHDVMSLVKALAEACGSSGAYVHLGVTSYDIVDTANALQFRDAIGIIEQRLNDLEKAIMEKASQCKEILMIGRTHGQHALPITLGFKFAVWMREISRHIRRLDESKKRVVVGKMSGAVGTQAGLGENASEIQALVMRKLGLAPADISTQIIQRDRHAEIVCLLALIATTLENFATEIRELQRPEIAEAFESFDAAKQVGSSTLPHKRNPELCERVCGLARIVRSLVVPALENMVTWHERDLTHSSTERILFPEAFILTDYILFLMYGILTTLRVDGKQMLKNTGLTQGRNMSESVMMALTKKGVDRQEAHELLRKLTIKSEVDKRPLKEILSQNKKITGHLTLKELDKALDTKRYLGTALEQIDSAIRLTNEERKSRLH